MESFVRRVQDKIVETLTSSVFGEARANKESDRELKKTEEEGNAEQQEGPLSRQTLKENREVSDTENYFERRKDNCGKNAKVFADPDEEEEHDANNDSAENRNCHAESQCIHEHSSEHKLTNPSNADKIAGMTLKISHNNSALKEEEEDEVEEEEEEEEEEEDDYAPNSMTLMGLYTEYQESVKLEERKIRHLEESIFLGNLVQHYVGLLGMIQNVEGEFAKRIKKGELSRSNVISNIRRGMKRNMVKEGRIQKKTNDDGSTYLNKKYQKLYIAHTLLENDYDELYEKYETLKIDHEDLQSLQNTPNNDPEANLTRAGFKGRGFKIGKKLVSYNSDR